MPRDILSIDVHDEKFKKFVESFKEYKADTEKLNEVWRHFEVLTKKPRAATEALNKAINQARKSSDAMGKTWAQIGKHIGDSDRKLSHFGRTIHGVERGLAKVARIGLSLGKFALAAGGIGMIGGLFGLDALANSAMQRQKSARGLGMPIGQVSAFKTYMEPYLNNPGGTLASIINARQTPQGQAALVSLGFTPEQYRHPKNRMAFAEQVLESVRSLYLRHKAEGNEQLVLQARGVQNLGISMEEARRLANTPNGQLHSAFAGMTTAARQMQVSGRIATEWTNLKVQLHAAGIAIETALTNKLAPLAPLIGQLSKKIINFIDEFVNTKDVNRFITTLTAGLKGAVHFIESKQLRSDLHELANAAHGAAKALGYIASAPSGAQSFFGGVAHGIGQGLSDVQQFFTIKGLNRLFAGKGFAPINPLYGYGALSGYYSGAGNWRIYNNPGDISRIINGHREYKAYPSMAAGYQAIASHVLGYGGPRTVANLVSTYEGHNAHHLAEHIAKIAQWMHVGKNQKLDLSNTATLAHLVAGLAEFEHPHREGMRQLYSTIRDAIVDGMKSVTIQAHSSAGSRIFTAAHAAIH